MMKLDRIVPLSDDPAAGPAGDAGRRYVEPAFALFSRRGTRILWGYAPGANILGEPPATEKIARLKKYFADHDALDGPQGQAQQLDIKAMSP
jgi:hypothetical protein